MSCAAPRWYAGLCELMGAGRIRIQGCWGVAKVSNITSHPTKGIGGWTDSEIKQALVKGVGRDGRIFKPPMARHIYFSKMTEDDLNSLVVWLRTLPPLE